MHASLVSSVGVVVDGTIIRRCEEPLKAGKAFDDTSSPSSSVFDSTTSIGKATPPLSSDADDKEVLEELHYECKATGKPLHQTVFHAMDVLPFGFHSPSTVFGVIGRHTNRGLVTCVTPDGVICVAPYRTTSRGPLTAQYVRTRPLKHTVNAPQHVTLDTAWLASVRRESQSASAMAEVRELGTHEPGVAGLHPREMKVPTAPLSRGVPGRTSSPTSISGLPRPTTPTRGSPQRGGGGSRGDPHSPNQLGSSSAESFSGAELSFPDAAHLRQPAPAVVESFDLRDISLPPPLSTARQTPPLKVGSQVLARRYGCQHVLHPATVLAVTYDVAYRLRYDADGGVDEGVLHNDVLLIDDSETESCTVRDRVVVALQLQTTVTVIEAMGGGRYRGVLVQAPSHEVEFTTRNLVAVSPVLVDALYACPKHVELFRSLDPTHSGQVRWKNVRHAILRMEHFGQSLSFQTLGEIQREMCILRRRVEPQMLHKVPVQEEEMFLSFNEFEYVLLRALNPL